MARPRIQLRRAAAAALMPLCLLWVFAACVLICARESAETHGPAGVTPTVERNGAGEAPDCEGCPIATLLTATTPRRATPRPNLQAADRVSPSLLWPASSAAGMTPVAPYHPPPDATAPPPQLLPALRI